MEITIHLTVNTSLLNSLFTHNPKIGINGRKEWRVNGKLHRYGDFPAIIGKNGHQEYWKHGVLHRENGPAITDSNGNQFWYFNGKLHNKNGPAIVYFHNTPKQMIELEWWENGVLIK